VECGFRISDFKLQKSEIHIPQSQNRVQITKESFFVLHFVTNLENYCNFGQFFSKLTLFNDE
jgi:hypothetical protein